VALTVQLADGVRTIRQPVLPGARIWQCRLSGDSQPRRSRIITKAIHQKRNELDLNAGLSFFQSFVIETTACVARQFVAPTERLMQ